MNRSSKRNESKYSPLRSLLIVIRHLICIGFIVLAYKTTRNHTYTVAAAIEFAVILVLTNLFGLVSPKLSKVLNKLFLTLFNIQLAVLYFASTYIDPVMLSNLDSVEDISGNAHIYIAVTAILFICGFIPFKVVGKKFYKKPARVVSSLLIAIAAEAAMLIFIGTAYSPIANYIILIKQEYKSAMLKQQIESAQQLMEEEAAADSLYIEESSSDEGESSVKVPNTEFYSDEIADYYEKDSALTDPPNIFKIFTEGQSQIVIEDERNITPNISEFQEKSISFTNYYNHTFATFRGIIGQLYSGYQLDNMDENNLVSIQSILSDNGYRTSFINTEPNHEEFTEYLNNLGFDEVLGSSDDTLSGETNTYSDEEAYALLWDTINEYAEADEPFFTAIYTYGTHATLSSRYEVFGDGSDDELNKFYNADYWFGNFLEKFEESELSENTIIIFTSDHATYQDNAFAASFSNYKRAASQLDEIPFCIYYSGIDAQSIDVSGRNTLDFAPTILDFLDISAPNFFLGESLFADMTDDYRYDTVFFCQTSPISSRDGKLENVTGDELSWFEEKLYKYFALKISDITLVYDTDEDLEEIIEELMEDEILVSSVETIVSDDGYELEILYYPTDDKEYDSYQVAIWSSENCQDDLEWYDADEYTDEYIHFSIPLEYHTLTGEINIHIYGSFGDDSEVALTTTLILS